MARPLEVSQVLQTFRVSQSRALLYPQRPDSVRKSLFQPYLAIPWL